MNFAIIGCGLIGKKRAASLESIGKLVITADTNLERAEALAKPYKAEFTNDWNKAVTHPDVDIVIVATTHDQLAPIALTVVKSKKHLLLEKPGARRASELDEVLHIAKKNQVHTHVGFNHRFHPAMQKAKELIDDGSLGPLYFIRGRYGHGGRIGYDQEWRSNPQISGGGELLDQGAHLIDLSLWYFQEYFTEISGQIATYFWDMPVEDNAFLTLKTNTGKIAQLQVTWTEWKNLFSLEITGRDAKIHIEGLGGSYGTERLAFYQMKPEMGPPDTTIYEYPGPDQSWNIEIQHFMDSIQNSTLTTPDIDSTQQVLSVIETVYRQNNVPWLTLSEVSL